MSFNPFAKKMKNIETPVTCGQPPIVRIDGVQRGVDGVLRYRIKTIDDDYDYEYIDRSECNFDLKHQEQTEVKQTHCANCGAPLNPAKARCEYCKSYYKEEDEPENYVLESL